MSTDGLPALLCTSVCLSVCLFVSTVCVLTEWVCIHRLVDDRMQFASDGQWGRGLYFADEAACPSTCLPAYPPACLGLPCVVLTSVLCCAVLC